MAPHLHRRARLAVFAAAGVAVGVGGMWALGVGRSAPPVAPAAASTPPAPQLRFVPVTVDGAAGCLAGSGFDVVRRTERSLVGRRDELRRVAILVYAGEQAAEAAQRAHGAEGTADAWLVAANARVRAPMGTTPARTALFACLVRPLAP